MIMMIMVMLNQSWQSRESDINIGLGVDACGNVSPRAALINTMLWSQMLHDEIAG